MKKREIVLRGCSIGSFQVSGGPFFARASSRFGNVHTSTSPKRSSLWLKMSRRKLYSPQKDDFSCRTRHGFETRLVCLVKIRNDGRREKALFEAEISLCCTPFSSFLFCSVKTNKPARLLSLRQRYKTQIYIPVFFGGGTRLSTGIRSRSLSFLSQLGSCYRTGSTAFFPCLRINIAIFDFYPSL